MRTINKIIIHSTATPEGRAVTVADIDRWHRDRKWNGIGYHYVIYLDGSVHTGRNLATIGAHTSGHNGNSIGIAYVGGTDAAGQPKDTRTPEQRRALDKLICELRAQFPNATVHGHNEFGATACPSFNVQTEL
jgi:N-acetylmuramoyl-L-alanine amidase